jgi:hypothetical protein
LQVTLQFYWQQAQVLLQEILLLLVAAVALALLHPHRQLPAALVAAAVQTA